MKVKKIIDICKKDKRLILLEGEEFQWVSDGGAVYPLINLPRFDVDGICATYDINDKQKDKMFFQHEDELPKEYVFDDVCKNEIEIEFSSLKISISGKELIPFDTSQGIAFIDGKYLDPLWCDDMLGFYERTTKSGQIYFVVKTGMILQALINPYDVVNKDFVTDIETLAAKCRIALENKNQEAPHA